VKYGLAGIVVVALCCFTPILVILLGLVGLSAVLGWLDIVLLRRSRFSSALPFTGSGGDAARIEERLI
jgi:hypothetical protein